MSSGFHIFTRHVQHVCSWMFSMRAGLYIGYWMITPPRHLSSHQWKDLTNGRTEAGSPIHHLPHNHCSSDQNISMFGCPVNRTFEHGKPEHLSTSDELNMDQLTLWDWDQGTHPVWVYREDFLAQFFSWLLYMYRNSQKKFCPILNK